MVVLLLTPGTASAAPRISVSRSTGLDPAGATITVRGSGFDVNKGIYVAVCVDTGPGNVPTPCLGGMDTSGTGSGSVWISSNPPSYGQGLAKPYGPGGTFTVTLRVVARDPVTGTDCTKVACAAVTRADHTRTSDRSQDARVPLRFATKAPQQPRTTTVKPTTTTPKKTTTTTTAKATTTTTTTAPPPTTTVAPTTTQPVVTETAATESDGGSGWWIAGAAAVVLAAIATTLLLRRRRASN